ncbi:EvpB family type VI secretion protein [Salmonella sp. NCTC 11881]|nr:EvpB family type VI secretion protein [Salmonella sp. NCTC 11881]
MANSNMQATDAVAQDTASASGEFDALLNQAFRPKTTQAAKSRGSRGADAGATGAGEHDHRQR